jgi:hypothetical protein
MNDTPQRPGEDEQLRRLLHDTVDDVQPAHALGTIRAGTTGRSRARRGWLLGTGGAVVATAATVAAVAVLADPGTSRDPGEAGPGPTVAASPTTDVSATPSDAEPTPSANPETPTESAPPADELVTVPVYYLGETSRGPRLFREFHRLDGDGNALMAALTEAVSVGPQDPDYRTDWPAETVVVLAGVDEGDDGQIFVTLRNDTTDLRVRPIDMTPEEAQSSVEQLIYTAQAAVQTRAPVQLLLERDGASGTRTDTLLGVPVSEPLAEGDAARTLAQVWIIDPGEGAGVSSPFEVSGVAAAFEANVVWELRDGDTVVKEGFTTARECCTMSPYSFEVTAPPGEYTLVVRDSDPSAGEGPDPWQDTKRVTVVP